MTGFAVRAKDALVHVVLLMAGIALDRRRFIPLIVVAVGTFCVDVFPAERKPGLGMVKRERVFPG